MDSLTQIVLGAAIGEKTLGKKLGNKALLYGAIAGTIPDLDVFVGKWLDPITAIEIHRGFSHSILFFVLLSPILGWLLCKIEKKSDISLRQATVFWFLGLFTHALLDAFTTWGTQLLYPLDIKYSLHSIFVIDPLYTLPFLICMLLLMPYKRTNPKRQKLANLGLIISSCYLLFTVFVQQLVKSKFEARLLEENISYNRKITKPSPMNIILWNAIIETDTGYYLADYSFFDTQAIALHFYPKNAELVTAIQDEKVVRQLRWISEGWWLITQKEERLFFNDIRFGLLTADRQNPEFSFSYQLIEDDNTVQAIEVTNKSRGRAGELLTKLWTRLKGN